MSHINNEHPEIEKGIENKNLSQNSTEMATEKPEGNCVEKSLDEPKADQVEAEPIEIDIESTNPKNDNDPNSNLGDCLCRYCQKSVSYGKLAEHISSCDAYSKILKQKEKELENKMLGNALEINPNEKQNGSEPLEIEAVNPTSKNDHKSNSNMAQHNMENKCKFCQTSVAFRTWDGEHSKSCKAYRDFLKESKLKKDKKKIDWKECESCNNWIKRGANYSHHVTFCKYYSHFCHI